MTATALTAINATLTLATGAGPRTAACVAALTAAILLLPVLATTLVLAWHAARGTDPGPAAQPLLALVRILWGRGRR